MNEELKSRANLRSPPLYSAQRLLSYSSLSEKSNIKIYRNNYVSLLYGC
jgi:hypothetical protein